MKPVKREEGRFHNDTLIMAWQKAANILAAMHASLGYLTMANTMTERSLRLQIIDVATFVDIEIEADIGLERNALG